ncbi:MAG: hypothetical protein Kow00117_11940 [Phototrophicales bacterium]
MYDRPTAQELIEAVRLHLEQAIIPAVKADRKLYFQTLVAINVLKIVEREMTLREDHLEAEWERMNTFIEGGSLFEFARTDQCENVLRLANRTLCQEIRQGKYDDDDHALFAHLKQTVMEQLEVANPRYLKKIAAEDTDPSRDAWHNR